jgi:hypothetical protein
MFSILWSYQFESQRKNFKEKIEIYDLLLFGIVRVPSLRDLGVPESEMMTVGVRLLNFQMAGMLIGGISCRSDEPTAPDSAPSLGVTAAAVLSFTQVSVSFFNSCGITTSNQAYCWGDNVHGQIGDGTVAERHKPTLVAGGRQRQRRPVRFSRLRGRVSREQPG